MKISACLSLLGASFIMASAIPPQDLVEDSQFSKRVAPVATNVEVCLISSTTPDTTVSQAIINTKALAAFAPTANSLNGAPWLPFCHNLNSSLAEKECDLCQDAANFAFITQVPKCEVVGAWCLVAIEYCQAACVAFAAYTLYSAEQKCYCLHADCSDPPAGSRINFAAPEVYVDGGVYSVQLASGDGPVPATADYVFTNYNNANMNNMPTCSGLNLFLNAKDLYGFAT